MHHRLEPVDPADPAHGRSVGIGRHVAQPDSGRHRFAVRVRLALGDSVDYGVASGPDGHASIVLADNNAFAASRTAREVLNIVYGAQNAAAGLFFPTGLNGPIH